MTGSREQLERLDDKVLLRIHDDIHRIMEARALDMKRRHREMKKAESTAAPGLTANHIQPTKPLVLPDSK